MSRGKLFAWLLAITGVCGAAVMLQRRKEPASAADFVRESPTGAAHIPTAAASDETTNEWHMLLDQPASPARDQRLAETLSTLAVGAPQQALRLALAETHQRRRAQWRDAALRGWATADAPAAAQWALALPARERETALAAVLTGAAHDIAAALMLARQLCATDPGLAPARIQTLIAALAQQGSFEAAVHLATTTGEADQRTAWLAAAYSRWAESQPQSAAASAFALPGVAERSVASNAVIAAWAQTGPETLADYAVQLPAGDTRTYALGEALRQWVELDAVAAAAWLDGFDPNPDLDDAVAAIATRPFLATRRPDVAIGWAESITDARLRTETLGRIAREWALADRAAAVRYVGGSRDFSAEERADLVNALGGY